MATTLFLRLVFAHIVAGFFLQGDKMVKGKNEGSHKEL